jgi:hypothetical protein
VTAETRVLYTRSDLSEQGETIPRKNLDGSLVRSCFSRYTLWDAWRRTISAGEVFLGEASIEKDGALAG